MNLPRTTTRGLARSHVGIALIFGACNPAFHQSGIVDPVGKGVSFHTFEGRGYHLLLPPDAAALRHLEGTTVVLDGVRVGPWLRVQDWRVTVASDGSEPYVGQLRNHGSNLVLEDRNSGMPIVIDAESMAQLAPYAGHLVLVVGFVVGAQQVRVVGFRVLDE